MIDKMIVDADLCIKLGGSERHKFLYDILPLIAKEVYIHTQAYSEVLMPSSAVSQLKKLIEERKVSVVGERNLDTGERVMYSATYKKLESVMMNPKKPNKNKGEVCSLAYAKAKGIPVFATDEKNLQPIIDKQLNTGMDDIKCIRIVDIVIKAREKELDISRKTAKALWWISGKPKEKFDAEIWPITTV